MKFLIINGATKFATSNAQLNKYINQRIQVKLNEYNHTFTTSYVDQDYDLNDEVKKWKEADVIIFHYPLWWMTMPWTAKKYFDTVLMQGVDELFTGDGRSRNHPEWIYGSGGLLHNKKYMLMCTMNAPYESFYDDDSFWNTSFDNAMLHIHKIFQFLGMKPLKTFAAHDIMKNLNFTQFSADLEQYLTEQLANIDNKC